MIRRLIRPLAQAVRWAFDRPAPGLDVMLAAMAGGWSMTALCAPQVFEMQSYVVLRLIPSTGIAAIMAALALAHAVVARQPHRAGARQVALGASALVWLGVAGGFAAGGGWTAVTAYGVIGVVCLAGMIYVEVAR